MTWSLVLLCQFLEKDNGESMAGKVEDNHILFPCSDGCCYLLIERYGDSPYTEEQEYSVSFVSSYLAGDHVGLLGRIRAAIRMLKGKPVYHAEVQLSSDRYDSLVAQMTDL